MYKQIGAFHPDGLTGRLVPSPAPDILSFSPPATKLTATKDDYFIELSEHDSQCTIDWLAFTLPSDSETLVQGLAENIANILFGGDWQSVDRGRYGYSHRLTWGTGSVLYCPSRPEMGVHVELPSSCLSELSMNPYQVVELMHEYGGRAARLDVALDTDSVTMADIIRFQREGLIVSRTQHRQIIENLTDGSFTLYIGSANSRRLVRIYDKGIQAQLDRPLVRIEVQFRAEYAHIAANHVLAGYSLRDLLVSSVDFRDDDDSNTTRRTRMDWWETLLDGAERVSFAAPGVPADLDRAYRWVTKQVLGTLAQLSVAFDGSGWLRALISHKVDSMPVADFNRGLQWRAAVGLSG